jgi:predicted nucleic acid-binding protein
VRVFIDSNVPMYVAGADHPNRDAAHRFLARVQRGEVEGCTSTEVLQEILYRYAALRRLDLARDVYDAFVQLCPVVFGVALADTDRARDILVDRRGVVSARDAVHAAVMLNHEVEWIASFDRGFEGIPGVRRVDLG